MKKALISEILELSVAERIELVEEIWESIAELPEALELTAEQKAELDRRLAEFEADPSVGIPWNEVKARIRL